MGVGVQFVLRVLKPFFLLNIMIHSSPACSRKKEFKMLLAVCSNKIPIFLEFAGNFLHGLTLISIL